MYSLLAQHFTMSCAESTDCPGQVRRRSVKPAAVQYCLLLSVTGSHYCHCGPCAPHKAAPRMSLVATGGLRVRTQTQAPLLLISNAAPSIGTKPATQQQDCHRALYGGWRIIVLCINYLLFQIYLLCKNKPVTHPADKARPVLHIPPTGRTGDITTRFFFPLVCSILWHWAGLFY